MTWPREMFATAIICAEMGFLNIDISRPLKAKLGQAAHRE